MNPTEIVISIQQSLWSSYRLIFCRTLGEIPLSPRSKVIQQQNKNCQALVAKFHLVFLHWTLRRWDQGLILSRWSLEVLKQFFVHFKVSENANLSRAVNWSYGSKFLTLCGPKWLWFGTMYKGWFKQPDTVLDHTYYQTSENKCKLIKMCKFSKARIQLQEGGK